MKHRLTSVFTIVLLMADSSERPINLKWMRFSHCATVRILKRSYQSISRPRSKSDAAVCGRFWFLFCLTAAAFARMMRPLKHNIDGLDSASASACWVCRTMKAPHNMAAVSWSRRTIQLRVSLGGGYRYESDSGRCSAVMLSR